MNIIERKMELRSLFKVRLHKDLRIIMNVMNVIFIMAANIK